MNHCCLAAYITAEENATARERERCAKLIETLRDTCSQVSMIEVLNAIIEAIRSGPIPTPPEPPRARF